MSHLEDTWPVQQGSSTKGEGTSVLGVQPSQQMLLWRSEDCALTPKRVSVLSCKLHLT